jgi:hypothetical protein
VPPIELDDVFYFSLLEPLGNAQRDEIGWLVSQTLDGMLIQVVIVIVADHHHFNGRKVFQLKPGRYQASDATDRKR